MRHSKNCGGQLLCVPVGTWKSLNRDRASQSSQESSPQGNVRAIKASSDMQREGETVVKLPEVQHPGET